LKALRKASSELIEENAKLQEFIRKHLSGAMSRFDRALEK
jgi:hypothetical protein